MRAGGVTTPEIRRRVPSCQREDDGGEHEHDTSIRVVQTTPSSNLLSSQAASQGRSYRKAVPTACEEDGKADGAGAGSMYLEQVALSYRGQIPTHQKSNIAESVTSASGNGLPDHNGKVMPPYQRREGSDDKSCSLDPPFSPSPSDVTQTVPLPSSQHEGSLLSSSSASTTLAEIGRSLQWSQKFPQGRHLSRATSIATKVHDGYANESSSIGSKLSEARAGLRLLAKRREEVAEDEESKTRERRWGKHKWILFVSVIVVFAYGTLGLTYSLMTWAGAWDGARLSVIVDPDIVIRGWQDRRGPSGTLSSSPPSLHSVLSVASSLCLLTSIVGLSGTILNSRPILALYSFLLWPSLLSMLSVGYTGYKRNNLRLDLKLNQTWSRYLNDLARLQVQELVR